LNPKEWQFPDLKYGDDLATEHEKYLANYYSNNNNNSSMVFVYNYPKDIKPFYMKLNEDGLTVNNFDLLAGRVGEIAGGSQREDNIDKLQQSMQNKNMNMYQYQWYIDLRRYGSIPHSGYGVGFERLLCFITGMDNIKDVIPFPRYRGHIEF
jgi:asparaginyl-tRNA synthetase